MKSASMLVEDRGSTALVCQMLADADDTVPTSVDTPLETFPIAVDARYVWYRQGLDLVRRRLPLDSATPSEVVAPSLSVDFLRLTASHAFVVRYAGPVSKILRVAK